MLLRFFALAGLFCTVALHAQLKPLVVCGSGITLSSGGNKGIVGCGMGFTKSIYAVELGAMGPQSTRSAFTGYASGDVRLPFHKKAEGMSPFFLGGYSYLFQVGHAATYGIGTDIPMPQERRMILELRNYSAFANPAQQYLQFRIGWIRPAK